MEVSKSYYTNHVCTLCYGLRSPTVLCLIQNGVADPLLFSLPLGNPMGGLIQILFNFYLTRLIFPTVLYTPTGECQL